MNKNINFYQFRKYCSSKNLDYDGQKLFFDRIKCISAESGICTEVDSNCKIWKKLQDEGTDDEKK